MTRFVNQIDDPCFCPEIYELYSEYLDRRGEIERSNPLLPFAQFLVRHDFRTEEVAAAFVEFVARGYVNGPATIESFRSWITTSPTGRSFA
jgi:hypothetical protein